MKYKCNIKLKFLQDIDLFSRKLELYYNGKPEKTPRIGTFFTVIYISIFLTIFLYKFIKVFEKHNGTFYVTYTFEKSHHLLNYQMKIFMVVLLWKILKHMMNL